METVFVKMLKAFGSAKANETVELEAAKAAEYIEAGLAEKVETPVDKGIENLTKTLEAKYDELLEKVNTAVKAAAIKTPAIAKDDSRNFGEFLVACGKAQSKDHRTAENAYNLLVNKYGHNTEVVRKTNLNETTNTQGQYLVPEEWYTQLVEQNPYDTVCFPSRVRIIPSTTNTLHVPVLDQTAVPSGTGTTAFLGGVAIGYVAEGTAPSGNTQPAFKQVNLTTAKKVMALTEITRELLDNSPISVESIVTNKFQQAFVRYVDSRVFNGAGGSSDMTGVINHAATVAVKRQTANSITLRDITRMYAGLAPGSAKSCVWVVNAAAWANLYQMVDASGRAIMLPNFQNATDAFTPSIFGIPVVRSEFLPTIGTPGDLMLLDLNEYLVGVNKQLMIDVSPHYAFNRDVLVYRMTARLDGIPGITAKIPLADGVNFVSPFVQLDVVGS